MTKYQCDSCGLCCRHLIIEIEELDLLREPRLIPVVDPIRIPLGMVLVEDDDEPCEEQIHGYGTGGMLACGETRPCQMLDGNRCTIYPTRPSVCVAFRAGSEKCQELRAGAGLAPLLPIGA
jgi:Fe-S-cluster containining protein